MTKINLPKEMLKIEAFKSLPAKEKEEYITNLMEKIVQLNPEGITLSQIREATGLTYSTIWHHLEVLKCIAISRKISRGKIDVYYPFGSLNPVSHYNKNNVIYAVSTVQNSEGSFAYLQEKRENSLGSYTIVRAIPIPIELIGDIIKSLTKIKKKYSRTTK